MTETAVLRRDDQLARLTSACRESYQQKDYARCARYADDILAAWSKATPAAREKLRKDAVAGIGFGCLACLKLRDVDHALVFFHQAVTVKKVCWELGIRVATRLARLDQPSKLDPVISKLREWAPRNPKYKVQLAALLDSIDESSAPQPRPPATIIKLSNFIDRPQKEADGGSTLWMRAFGRTVFAPASGRLTVVVNPKSACSTFKFNLWRQEYAIGATQWKPPGARGGIHRKNNTPLPKAPIAQLEAALFDKPVFSIVRNPYTRVLSAYLDKIAGNKKEKRHLLLSMGHAQNVPVAFGEFIDFISRQNPREMDAHHAPQAYLMQVDYLPYAKIGCVEEMDASIAAILSAGYGIPPGAAGEFRPHRTGASSLIAQYYTEEIAAKVRERFRVDFDRFGYSTDLADAHLPPRELESAAQRGRTKAEAVLRPVLRAAVAEHNKDYAAAFELLSTVTASDPELDAMKARILLKLDRPDEALALMESVIARVTNASHYWILLAECLVAGRRAKEAVHAAEMAASITLSEPILHRVVRTLKLARENKKAKAYREKIAAVETLTFGRARQGRVTLQPRIPA